MNDIDLQVLLATYLALCVIIVTRYFLVAGLFYWALWKRAPEKVTARRLTEVIPSRAVIRHEIRWSIVASLIYAAPGAIILEAWKNGGTLMYSDVSLYDWAYIPLSVFVYLFIQDTYFYWTHRWMHHRRLFRYMHKVHHESRQPTPWAAFSFHPWESILGAVVIPSLVFIVPIHVGAVLFILVFMTLCSVLNHAGFEIYPDSWLRGFIGRHFITAAHHNLHHSDYRCNLALYFRFWDKLMGTDAWEGKYDFLTQRAGPGKPQALKLGDGNEST
jgi:lathosterol oxidase